MHERGPEAVKPLLDRLFIRCGEIVVGQDGIIDRLLGDAVMALFNVPIAHEDHVGRAISAATQIQLAVPRINEEVGEKDLLKVGIGISTGLVFTGALGSSSCRDYIVLGDVVNVASRLQGQAGPGEIIVTGDVYSQVKSAFPNARQREFQLKGIAEPVQAYLLN